MARTISIGSQGFDSIRERGNYYVDKTEFIREWWEAEDEITLITRPRRFGKTLNLSMLNCFFSVKYQGRSDLFEGLKIWESLDYQKFQGTYPVIFMSFADVKQGNYEDAVQKIKNILVELYSGFSFLQKWEGLSEKEKVQFAAVSMDMTEVMAQDAVKNLSNYLSRYYGKKVIILLDEYDTPMQEAYLYGYWDRFIMFMRSLFNASLKTNPYLERALLTGITRVSKESVFSDLNNINVVTTTSNAYEVCFGFTQEEVYSGLEEMGLSDQRENVKKWYDGFTFGRCKDIYNPWSITNYLKKKEYKTYWADTSSNGLISSLLQRADADVKEEMEMLLKGECLEKILDEQIIFDRLEKEENAIWSLLLASGYLCVDSYRLDSRTQEKICCLKLTNFEVNLMFEKMIRDWFGTVAPNYNHFVAAMLEHDLEEMNYYMNRITLSIFSFFDTADGSRRLEEPERFYHGFVLGMLVDLRNDYEVLSNRESGLGRYDVMLVPKNPADLKKSAVVMEFKVHRGEREESLEDTVCAARRQIDDKKYDSVLLEKGISQERIYHYGFAFRGKEVLIG